MGGRGAGGRGARICPPRSALRIALVLEGGVVAVGFGGARKLGRVFATRGRRGLVAWMVMEGLA